MTAPIARNYLLASAFLFKQGRIALDLAFIVSVRRTLWIDEDHEVSATLLQPEDEVRFEFPDLV